MLIRWEEGDVEIIKLWKKMNSWVLVSPNDYMILSDDGEIRLQITLEYSGGKSLDYADNICKFPTASADITYALVTVATRTAGGTGYQMSFANMNAEEVQYLGEDRANIDKIIVSGVFHDRGYVY